MSLSGPARQPEAAIDGARTVSAAFSGLSFNQKRVLEMAYFEGFSQSEIAGRLHEPLGTVKSWMRSALGRLHRWGLERSMSGYGAPVNPEP